MLTVLEAEVEGYLVDSLLGAGKLLLGKVYNLVLNMFLRCEPSFLFHQVTKIVGR